MGHGLLTSALPLTPGPRKLRGRKGAFEIVQRIYVQTALGNKEEGRQKEHAGHQTWNRVSLNGIETVAQCLPFTGRSYLKHCEPEAAFAFLLETIPLSNLVVVALQWISCNGWLTM